MVSTTESSGNLVQHRLLVPAVADDVFTVFYLGELVWSRSVW
jgi:hypothetical protein